MRAVFYLTKNGVRIFPYTVFIFMKIKQTKYLLLFKLGFVYVIIIYNNINGE